MVSGSRNSTASPSEERARRREGRELICRTFGVNDWREGIPRLIDKPADIIDELKKHPDLWAELSKKVLEENLPSNEELLEFKDYLMIPDNKWGYVVTTFKLRAGSTINYIRQLRLQKGESMNVPYATMLIRVAKDNNLKNTSTGAYRSIKSVLETCLRKDAPKETLVCLKFAFDACRVTNKNEQVIGTMTHVQDGANYKSPWCADQFIIWIGRESYDEYKQELNELIPEINKLIADNKIIIDGKEYVVEPYLVLDMKSLCTVLGLYEVYRPNTNFKCCWCEVTDANIDDFTKQSWKFRDLNTLKAQAASGKRPTDNAGVKVCIINLNLNSDIRCS